MENLKKALKEIYNSGVWKYYEKAKFNNPFDDEQYEAFAEQYIRHAQKSQDNPLCKHLHHYRSIKHIVIVYFLGIMTYEKSPKTKSVIDAKIRHFKQKINEHNLNQGLPEFNIIFPFFWFLISLFHDSGYWFEKNKNYTSISDFEKKQNIVNKIKKPCGIPKCLSKSREKYYSYKRAFFGKPDHGILAGIMLWDSLKKIYQDVSGIDSARITDGLYYYNGLYWSEKVLSTYNYCAWIVLGHNMFFCNKNRDPGCEDKYQNNDLCDLIIDKPIVSLKKISFFISTKSCRYNRANKTRD